MPPFRAVPDRFELIGMHSYLPTRKGVRVANIFEMGVCLQSRRKIIANDRVGPVKVSTVFLCIDYGFSLDGSHRPVLWETMLFSDEGDCDEDAFRDMGYDPYDVVFLAQEQWRYTSRRAAVDNHAHIVQMLRSGLH